MFTTVIATSLDYFMQKYNFKAYLGTGNGSYTHMHTCTKQVSNLKWNEQHISYCHLTGLSAFMPNRY